MRLKRVRIFGFKTFADRSEFTVDGGIIAVVGPNGCGKSNLVDAILWGLGEGNARHLRAQNNQDVIFSGSSRRKPLGFAEVSLLFDNEDGALPIDTPEVSVTRRLNRAGESEYSINRQSCRQRDIYDLLADSGLGRAGYAIVGQKEIDTALSASAEDRRAWIDEAAGVQRYRARKTESMRRLAQANEHLTRIGDILQELNTQREPLREEAESARRYKSVQESLREIEVGLLVNDVAAAVRELGDLEVRISDSLKLAQEESLRADSLDHKIRTIGSEISKIELELDTIRGLQHNSITALERAEADLRLAQQRLESLDQQEESLHVDGAQAASRIKEAEEELARLKVEEATERAAFEELRSTLSGVGEEAKQLSVELRQIEDELHKAREVHARRLRFEAERAHRTQRKTLIGRELAGLERSQPELDEAAQAAQTAFDALAEEAKALGEQIKEIETSIQDLHRQEHADAENVRKALAEKAALEGRRRGIEATIDAHEGLTQGARAVMEAVEKGQLRGSYHPVGQAVEADKDLALAVETALGAASNDLIVDHESEAKSAIEWLKSNRAGRATFQPIPLMRPQEVGSELRRVLHERGVIGRANELVRCDAKHRPVIDSLLGRVVVVEDLDVALRLVRTSGWSRLVTQDGEVVHSSGAVTGGHSRHQTYGLVQRKADLREIDEALRKLDKTVGEFEKRSNQRRQRAQESNGTLTEARLGLTAKNSEVAEARSYLQILLDEQKSGLREREKLVRELESLTQKDDAEEPEVDVDAIEARRDAVLKTLAARSADAEQAETRLREAEARVRQSADRVRDGDRRLSSAVEAESMRMRRVENLEPERERARTAIHLAQKAAVEAKEKRTQADASLDKLQAAKRERLETSLRLTEEAKESRANATSIGDVVHQAELSRARADAKRAAALQRLVEEYGLNEDDAIQQEGLHEVPSDAHTVVNRLRRELRAMGDVNLGAIEAYDRLSVRLEELTAQDDDIRSGIREVEASIRELDKLTRDRFTTTFEAVQREFALMFERLFGGGEGRLRLSDADEVLETGVEIEVTLPGKKRQPLNLLSGGERSLCASAFLFSLLKVKPSPLVVLDEVDAPLDGRNVERFASLLKDFGEQIQFIVITHNPTTIEIAPVWLGVTMQEPGVSTLVPARLPEGKAMIERESAIHPGSNLAELPSA